MLGDLMNVFSAMSKDTLNYESRKLGKTKVDGLEVSTVYTSDMGYETAIIDANNVHPVERYPSRQEATKGHQKWCKDVVGMTHITKLGYGEIVDECKVRLKRTRNRKKEEK